MAEHFNAPSLGIDLDGVSTTQEFQLGTIVCGEDSSGSYSAEYVYVQANGAVAQYAVAELTEGQMTDISISDATAGTKPLQVVVPQVAFADNEYGWAVLSGNGTVLCISAGAAAPDVRLYLTSTDGQLDDVALTNGLVHGLRLTASEGAVGSKATFHACQRMTVNTDAQA
jgi:hypothetical protein